MCMSLPPLEKSIFRTILYFDIHDYPLTAWEVWKWLYKPEGEEHERTLEHVEAALESSEVLQDHIERTEGFYHLIGRSELVPERKKRNNRVHRQLKKTERMVKLLRLFPSIRMIAIASSLATGNVHMSSDIDLVIVSKKNEIWLARLFAAGFLKLLKQRPSMRVTRDRFCLSFFVSEESLKIEHASFGSDDIVFHYYVNSFTPIYDPYGIHERMLKENIWLARYLPHAHVAHRLIHEVDLPQWIRWWHRIFEFVTYPLFHGFMSEWYRRFQLSILPPTLKSLANIDSRVIISDTMLKFHTKDNRRDLLKLWSERAARYE